MITIPPLLKDLLEEEIINLVEKDKEGKTAFETDHEYMLCMITYLNFRETTFHLRGELRSQLAEAPTKESPAMIESTARQNLSELRGFLDEFIAWISRRGQLERRPRMVRAAELLNLTPKEVLALIYTFSAATWMLQERYRPRGGRWNFSAMCELSGMSVAEGCEFLSTHRQHCKEHIISPDEDKALCYEPMVSHPAMCILFGVSMHERELLKVDKTVLAQIMAEEGADFDCLRVSQRSLENEESDERDGGEDEKSDAEDDDDVYNFMRKEVANENVKVVPVDSSSADLDSATLAKKPYSSNLEYLSDHFDWVGELIKVELTRRSLQSDLERNPRMEQQLLHMRGRERMYRAQCERRLAASKGVFRPRLERLVDKLSLDEFERLILLILVGNTLSDKVSPSEYGSRTSVESVSIGTLISAYAGGDFQKEIDCRKAFYKSSRLVRDGIIRLDDTWLEELANVNVTLDRRMLDFVVGLDTEIGELVEGSHLYKPKVKMDMVVLPAEQKDLLMSVVSNFGAFSRARKSFGLDDVMAYGSGMVILMYGPSGTGKTLTANALASTLGKQVLLINFPSLGYMNSDNVLKFIFREAKLSDAVLFFDECDSMFQTRDQMPGGVNLLLTELERHSGLVLMATNRAADLDEAMHRRITLAVEFRAPDKVLRRRIWQQLIPPAVTVAKDVDFDELSYRYELTGGLIKNAMLYALCQAVARAPKGQPELALEDLRTGAANQMRGRLRMQDFDRRLVPVHSLDDVIVSEKTREHLREIVDMEKARGLLFSQWGFAESRFRDQGTSCLFVGPPGTGKTLCAEAIGFETGKPLKVVNLSELVSKYVGETAKNIEATFKEAKALDLVLVFDDAEGLFGRRLDGAGVASRDMNNDTAVLLYHLDRHPGIVVVTTNLMDSLDVAFYRRFRFVVRFEPPNAPLRERMWRSFLPPGAPTEGVDFARLARYDFTGAQIKTAVFKGAARAALRSGDDHIVRHADLMHAADIVEKHTKGDVHENSMFL